ncbi:lactonase family protein [Streptomyces armeniacus]|uniref:lactonase family protein n=1 Tax=Streptomyces armeniacus TaxID=83291 RepID=UPI001FE6DE16|nr:lactonase family protein [Streptomyces armeniacus]
MSSPPPERTPTAASGTTPAPARRFGRRAVLGAALGAGVLGTGVLGATASGGASAAQRAPGAAARTRRSAAETRLAYLGTYGRGIITCTYDTATGALTETSAFGDITDPDFLALGTSGDVLYALHNGAEEGAVRAFTIGAEGKLSPLGEAQSTGGANVTHLSVHPAGGHLLSANYGAGSVAVHPIAADGTLGARTALVQHEGSGPDPRQEGPHAHQIITDPDGAYVFAVDLGTDRVYTYGLDTDSGALEPLSEAEAAPGAGPRHMVFHPAEPYAYVANELDSTVTAYAYDASTGALTPGETWPTLPDGEDPGTRNYPSEVAVSADGRYLYLANRGHDSVAWFAVEDGGAALSIAGTVPCGGTWPRHISLSPSGAVLFSGNQNSNNVGIFNVDPDNGAPTASGDPFATASLGCVLPT